MKEFITRNIQGGFVAASFLLGAYVNAQPTTTGVNALEIEKPALPHKWSLPVSFEYASSLQPKNAYERKVQESFTLIPTYKISDSAKASVMTALYRDDSNDEAGGTADWDNTRVSISFSRPVLQNKTWSNSISTTIPTNRSLREQTSYQGGLKLAAGLQFDEVAFGSSLGCALSYTRNFHEFDMTADGGFNVRETVGAGLDWSLPLYHSLNLQSVFVYTAGKTYRDDLRTKFVTEANLNWQAARELTLSAGTSNEGNALGPNGKDSNIEFFNDTTSMIKFGLTYVL